MLFIFALIATLFLPLRDIAIAATSSIGLPYLQWVWGNFDGVNYVSIARAGYQYPNFAYFPLYPLLISLIKKASDFRSLQIGLLISNLSLFISLFLLYKIARMDFDEKIAWRSIILLLIFPTAFFYGSVYADSLYLLLSLLSFYSARKTQWLPAGIFGYMAGATRLIGIVLVPALLLEWYLQKKGENQNARVKSLATNFFKERVFFLFLIPLGMISYGLYLQINFGDFLLFQKAMAVWGQSNLTFPPQVIFRYLKIFFLSDKNIPYSVAIVEFIATVCYFGLSLYVWKKVRTSYGLFMFLTFLIPTFTGTLQSMPRYILHTFPAFIALSLLTSKSKKVFALVFLLFLVLQLVFTALFTRGYFIA